MSKYWFKAKKYGWGWTPATIEGWICIGVYLIAITAYSFVAEYIAKNDVEFTLLFSGGIIILSTILVFISYKKGEKPGWRWGDRTK